MKPVHYFKALSDETRVRIVNVLRCHELSVNETVALLQTGQSRVSHHLKILTDAGFLDCRRDGVWAFYALRSEGLGRKLIDAARFLFRDDDRLDTDLTRAAAIVKDRSVRTRDFFNTVASDWDLLKREIMGDFDLNAALLEYLPACSALADLGCGTGDFIVRVLDKGIRTIGVDSSTKMLDLARRRFKSDNERPELRLGELEHLPLKDGEVGCATISMALHHLTDPQVAVAEANRTLEASGILIIAELDKHTDENMRRTYGDRWLGFSRGDIVRFLETAGFALLEQRSYPLRQGQAITIYKALKK